MAKTCTFPMTKEPFRLLNAAIAFSLPLSRAKEAARSTNAMRSGEVVIAADEFAGTAIVDATADEFAGWFWRQPAKSAVAATRRTTRRTFRRAMRDRGNDRR